MSQKIGFDKNNKPFPGVDGKSGNRVSVSFDALVKEFGVREGVAKYEAIASLEMDRLNPSTYEPERVFVFFNPATERGYRPDLVVGTLVPELRAQVDAILTTNQLAKEEMQADLTLANDIPNQGEEGHQIKAVTEDVATEIPVSTQAAKAKSVKTSPEEIKQ
jgi:hypothetical protein